MKTLTTILLTLCALIPAVSASADLATVTDFGGGLYIVNGSNGSQTVQAYGSGIYLVSPSPAPAPRPLPTSPTIYPGYDPANMNPVVVERWQREYTAACQRLRDEQKAQPAAPVLPLQTIWVEQIDAIAKRWDAAHRPETAPATWSLRQYQETRIARTR